MKSIKYVISFTVIGIMLMGVYLWIRHTEVYPSTSDAYIDASVVRIAPQVTGQVLQLPIKDHMHVNKGQLLLQIDPQPYQLTVQRASANLLLAEQQLASAKAAREMARAQVEQHKAEVEDAQHNNKRMQDLWQRKTVSKATAEQAAYKLKESQAVLASSESELNRATRQVEEAKIQIRVARTQLAQAQLDLNYTRLLSPADGFLGKVTVRPGDVVHPGEQLFPLVEDTSTFVDANFKETDLQRIRPGQPAVVEVDMYPGKKFNGTVESVSPASGVAFSLLPPENATGNWVKVTQRFPIRIAMQHNSSNKRLLVGASSSVTVDTSNIALP